ncbi:Mediator of RNA polymerase II transcription subunit 5 [Fulvia fulva]|uniref:Mediator of RNA polymerase II transcription subunit 5 n=1 Tax=Passalora fulva TaxID=5499 RepID=A0A9Q8PKZ5_PASFU|nr:Mediator of RNA polymerase II transcription subunit 5 [Fulvia fulva]KAK4610489.1 Mediator of RNA polymerase II transcription subunit 5 [Fulvia fulva]KAK4611013.1 Mediator of RNA polymerase II transcription subunit 5 [Fulvia fulva]UJO24393.1 Mediator of RNA polymerase II transcription subunit 5 [Fulvia fulva]WPV22171.1 Mediator of RNA polymerase II transcription subunit 5 [Fulvia fulva]WPV37044.1 Mediator of RNA polymerase II transcription subunit 5 [Fulvia fulva]
MPGIDAPPARDAWRKAFKNSFLRRLRADRLRAPLETLHSRDPARPEDIADVLISFRAAKGGQDDPLLFSYAKLLLTESYISSSDILLALLRHSTYGPEKTYKPERKQLPGLPSCEERMFILLTQQHSTTDLPKSALELHRLIHSVVHWLKAVSQHELEKQIAGDVDHANGGQSFGMCEALGALALSVLGNQSIRAVTKQKWWKAGRAKIVAEMESYDMQVLQNINSQYAGKLQQITGLSPYIALDDKGRPLFSKEAILNSVGEVSPVHSRAGLFIWLNAALAARPLTDDATIQSHLYNRYSGDNQALVSDLLVATFDVLTNSMLRKEPRQNVKTIRSFLVNKVPLIISALSGISAESCIQMALIPGGMISMDPLPPITSGATEMREYLTTARLEFLQACHLHGLVSEGAVAAILQSSVALPRVQKLNKEFLISQCANNVSRLESLVEDLDAFQGNAGAISGCVVETIHNLCMSKDTMSLKTVCNALIKKIPRMDIIMQYAQPSMLLFPLCNILNGWSHDQDQSEFTPQYEEFASILLLTLAIVHRYELHWSDIGPIEETFVSRLLDNMSTSLPGSELTKQQSTQLSKWIAEGLYAVDEHGETSGIGDEVMRKCPPQDFYHLVPTLFEQSVLACRAGRLPMKTFKGGLELLLEPFLLPSLIMGLGWLASHSWEDHNDAETLLQILDKLLKPSSSSHETQAMHKTILAIVATPLYESLQALLMKQPDKKKAAELAKLLEPYLNQQRTLSCRKGELDEWLQTESGLASHVQRGIRDLTTWASTSLSPPNPPPRYTFKEFAVACQVLEGNALLDAMVEEVAQSLNIPIALDVCVALACAPVPFPMRAQHETHTTGLTAKLRQSIRLVSENPQGLLDRKRLHAEILVMLNRRVGQQLRVNQVPAMAQAIPIQDQTAADQIMQELGLDIATTDNAMNNTGNIDQDHIMSNIDISANPTDQEIANMTAPNNDLGGNMQTGQASTGMMGNVDNLTGLNFGIGQSNTNNANQQMNSQDQDEDIFAGLDINNEMMSDIDFDFS